MLPRSALAWLAFLAAGLASVPASAADELSGSGDMSLVETSHTATLRMRRGHAELVVRRTLRNEGDQPEQAYLALDLPEGAVATGLRTLGMKEDKPFWFGADLLEAGAATEKYAAFHGASEAAAQPSALLSWVFQGHLALDLYPVPPHEPASVEYTLMLPTTYREGRDHVTLPPLGIGKNYASVVAVPEFPLDGLVVDGVAVGSVTRLKAAENVDVALTRHGPPLLGGALAMVPFAKNRFLVHQRIEAAARLSKVPLGAGVVVLIDASRSIDESGLEGEIVAAEAYLSHFEDAKVEVLTFDREVHARHGRLVPVKEAIADLATLSLARRNGSRVDDAIVRAGEILAPLPSTAPRRVVIFTDSLTRSSLAEPRLRLAIGQTHAIVHVVDMHRGAPSLERDDDHAWAPAVRATGGLAWSAGAERESADRGEASRRAFEELARPVRIDKIRYDIQNLLPDDLGFPVTLLEGEGIDDLRITSERVRWVRADGELWSTPVQTVLLPDEGENQIWAALAFGSSVFGELDQKEEMALATRGHAVSPVTSYLIAAPGERPALEERGLSLSGHGSGGGGGGGSSSCSMGSVGGNLEAMLRAMLAPRFAACGGGAKHAEIELETTLREVVDVEKVSVDEANDGVARCLEAAVWDLELPSAFRARHQVFTIRW